MSINSKKTKTVLTAFVLNIIAFIGIVFASVFSRGGGSIGAEIMTIITFLLPIIFLIFTLIMAKKEKFLIANIPHFIYLAGFAFLLLKATLPTPEIIELNSEITEVQN